MHCAIGYLVFFRGRDGLWLKVGIICLDVHRVIGFLFVAVFAQGHEVAHVVGAAFGFGNEMIYGTAGLWCGLSAVSADAVCFEPYFVFDGFFVISFDLIGHEAPCESWVVGDSEIVPKEIIASLQRILRIFDGSS